MDITPYVAPLVTALITAGATYAAIVSRLSRLEVSVRQLEGSSMDVHTLSNQLTALTVKLDELKSDVSKHNQLIERTYKLETETKAQWNRIDELRGELHDVKIGGSK